MSEQELRELDIEVAEKVFGIAPREVRPRASAEVVKVWTTNPAILCDGAWEACELKRHGDLDVQFPQLLLTHLPTPFVTRAAAANSANAAAPVTPA